MNPRRKDYSVDMMSHETRRFRVFIGRPTTSGQTVTVRERLPGRLIPKSRHMTSYLVTDIIESLRQAEDAHLTDITEDDVMGEALYLALKDEYDAAPPSGKDRSRIIVRGGVNEHVDWI